MTTDPPEDAAPAPSGEEPPPASDAEDRTRDEASRPEAAESSVAGSPAIEDVAEGESPAAESLGPGEPESPVAGTRAAGGESPAEERRVADRPATEGLTPAATSPGTEGSVADRPAAETQDVATSGGSITAAPVSNGKRFGAWLLEVLLIVVTLFVGWLIWSLIAWSRGQTPAKSLLGMRCISTDTGRAATWATMALREIVGKWLLGNVTFGITTIVSGIMILGESRQGIWDKMASTVVVDDPDGRLVG